MTVLQTQFWRGGVCNALIFHRRDLPSDESKWQPLFAAAMGSPDPYGRQLNGMGGGSSSLSKICIVESSNRDDADVDFTFVQVVIKDGELDLASNCGNMSAAIGPFAVDEGLVGVKEGERSTSVRVFNTNTQKVIKSTFAVKGSPAKFCPSGKFRFEGVPGTGSRITLAFLEPGGTKTGRALPTGVGVTVLDTKNEHGERISASLVDIANPGVFVDGSEIGIKADISPAELDENRGKMALLEKIRREGAERMGMDPNTGSVPKVVVVFPPTAKAAEEGVNIRCLSISMEQAHKAIPLTLALNLGAACIIEGTLPFMLVRRSNRANKGDIVIQHPSGVLEVGAKVVGTEVESAILHSTARLLMKGEVNVDA